MRIGGSSRGVVVRMNPAVTFRVRDPVSGGWMWWDYKNRVLVRRGRQPGGRWGNRPYPSTRWCVVRVVDGTETRIAGAFASGAKARAWAETHDVTEAAAERRAERMGRLAEGR